MLSNFNKTILAVALQTSLILTVVVTPSSLLAAAETTAVQAASKRQDFAITGLSLDQALLQFAEQARLQLLFKPSAYRHWPAPKVIGKFTAEQALEQLIKGLPVHYQWLSERQLRMSTKPVATLSLATEQVVAEALDASDTQQITHSATDLTRLAIQDERDLVRLSTGVSVVEGGRSGSNGYAIRGVDADRVAITVDGVPQAESFAPDVYQGYGYFNGTRNTTELENIQQVVISKGADSLSVGSGGIGGAVQFRTKNVADFIRPEQNFGLLAKVGYSSKNAEWRQVAGGAVRQDNTGALLQYTKRQGHQLKHFGGGFNGYGAERERPDPQDTKSESWLAKVEHCITATQCLDIGYEQRKQQTDTQEKSYSKVFGSLRTAQDSSPYQRWSAGYTWLLDDYGVDEFNVRYAKQKIEQHSVTKNYWETDPSHAYQIYDRIIYQDRDQVDVGLKSQEVALGNTSHQLAMDVQYAKNQFTNENHDTTQLKGSKVSVMSYNIIHPVKTTDINLRLQDSIQFNQDWSGFVGLRYDRYQHQPQLDSMRSLHLRETRALEEKTFSAVTWNAGLNVQLTDNLALQYKVGTGFRAPKAAEMYFEYTSPPSFIDANPDLKAEHAMNHELSLTFNGDLAQATVSGFISRYKDFIEERHQTQWGKNPWFGHPLVPDAQEFREEDHFQFVNIDRATVKGIEFNGRLHLDQLWSALPQGAEARLSFTQAQGRLKGGDGMRALQPFKLVSGVGFNAPSQNWGIHYDLSYFAGKRKRDTQQTTNDWRGEIKHYAKYLNQSAYVSDVRGYWHVTDNFTLSGGVYNLFNKKYSTWDSLRSIPEFGTTNMIGWQDKGLHRFTAPGRNFAVVMEARY